MSTKRLAVVCNYVLRADRIGGMDRFFVAYDKAAKNIGYEVDWFFPDVLDKTFYEGATIFSAEGNTSVEAFFLNHLQENEKTYTALVTHFTELCTPFYKRAKQAGRIKNLIAVDHNPRPLNGFSLKKQLKKRVKGFLYHNYITRFIGVSSYSAKCLVQDFGGQIASKTGVIHNGIDVDLFIIKNDIRGESKFLVASHLRKEKAIIDLIRAINSIKIEGVRVDIFGEGPEEENIKNEVVKLGLEDTIELKGSVSNLHNIYREYDYLIQPSKAETFGLSVIESLISNVPVITTERSGNILGEISQGINGYLFREGDYLALGKHIQEIIDGNKRIETTNFEILKNKYSLDRMVAEHINLLD